jgi:hypothetical protein
MNEPTESQLQQSIVNTLSTLGYQVLEIGRTRSLVSCQRCGRRTRATGWQGNTVGAPDLFVSHQQWQGRWIGLEVKRPKGVVRPEQKRLATEGFTTIVRSVLDAVVAVYINEKLHGREVTRLRLIIAQLAPDGADTTSPT